MTVLGRRRSSRAIVELGALITTDRAVTPVIA